MKKIYLFLACLCFSPFIFSQALFTVGNTVVEKEEFLRAYNKNKTPVTNKEKALRDYLDLYTKFKLKVKAAMDLRLDTLQQLQYDLQNFRSQVDESYMNNEKELAQLSDEAFNRSQKDIHALHFFIPIGPAMNAEDTAKAWMAINELREKLQTQSNPDYEQLAKEISIKYIPVKQGDLGFITAFSISYEYENIVYGLNPGELSKPYRSKKGLHLFKNIEERKAVGKWRVAQILLAFPPGNRSEFIKAITQKADSIHTALVQGADFAILAKSASDDKITYLTGGELPEFGTSRYDLAFENEVFKLNKDGDISAPFITPFGIHIVKRIKQTPVPADKSDANFLYDLKQKVQQDTRINAAREKFIKGIITQIGYKRNPAVKDAELFRYADSAVNINADFPVKPFPVSDKTIFSFSKSPVKGAEWLNFVREYKNNNEQNRAETNAAVFTKFISKAAQDYYKKHLEEYNADFRYQMEEFREGNILFEIMEKKVWGNAANDSAGLTKHYNAHKASYRWGPSAGVILFTCTSLISANESLAALKTGKSWKKIVEDGHNNVQADSGRYEISQLPIPADSKIVPGLITLPALNAADGSASFIRIVQVYEGNLQRSFEEARGLVINDYQNIIEEKWIEELRKKYPLKINETVYASLLK